MVQAGSKAVIRKAAPTFTAQAWWQNKIQEVSLEQFRGKFSLFC
jgi:alkyl hydroperoxide reductase subunit AhpC